MKHVICVEVAEKRPVDDGVEFDPSEWEFADIVEAYAMGLITCEVVDYRAEQSIQEQADMQRRLAAERQREREATG